MPQFHPLLQISVVLPSGLLIWISNSLIIARLCRYPMDHAVRITTIPTIILVTLAVKCASLVKIVADANTKHIARLTAANRGWDIVAPRCDASSYAQAAYPGDQRAIQSIQVLSLSVEKVNSLQIGFRVVHEYRRMAAGHCDCFLRSR